MRGRDTHPTGPQGECQVWPGRGRSREKAQARDFLGVSVGKARQGRGNSSGLAGWKNSGWPEAPGVVSSCLVQPGEGQGKHQLGMRIRKEGGSAWVQLVCLCKTSPQASWCDKPGREIHTWADVLALGLVWLRDLRNTAKLPLPVTMGPTIHRPSLRSGLCQAPRRLSGAGGATEPIQGALLFAEGTAAGKALASWPLGPPGDV